MIASQEKETGLLAMRKKKAKHDLEQDVSPEPFEELFGKSRYRPAPLPTLEHLDPADLSFVVIADVHIHGPDRPGQWGANNWRVEEAVRQINTLSPLFVIHLGDSVCALPPLSSDKFVIHEGDRVCAIPHWPMMYQESVREAKRILGGLGSPLYQVAGTHDVGAHNPYVHSQHACTSEKRKIYQEYFGDDYYSFEAKGCRFIVINNQLCNSGCPDEKEQERWLERELEKSSSSKIVFVLMHVPFFWRAPDEEESPKNMETILEPARSRLLNLMSRHRVNVIYSGHLEFGFANEWQGIHMRTLNSPSRTRAFLSNMGTPRPISIAAEYYDPYKVGYLVVRVKGNGVHESWVPTYSPVEDPPPQLARISGPRVVARPATETEDSVLGLVVSPPTPFSWKAPDGFFRQREDMDDVGIVREMVNDHWWRLAEDIGSKWLQTWPMPYRQPDYWADLERALTLGHLRGVKIAVPLPLESAHMEKAWKKMEMQSDAISAVVVCNGASTLSPDKRTDTVNARLTTWTTKAAPEDWIEACIKARELIPESIKVVLARLPIEGGRAIEDIKETARMLEGKADSLAVWMMGQDAPEKLWNRIASAAEIARSHRLELWVDAACWEKVREPRRSAYFLRLMALCQSAGVRLFWWNGPYDEAGLLDGYFDPTPLCYAAQAWQAMVDAPREPLRVNEGKVKQLRWHDQRSQQYVVWWHASDDITIQWDGSELSLPKNALVLDPLHGRLLNLSTCDKVPVCSWPLIARGLWRIGEANR